MRKPILLLVCLVVAAAAVAALVRHGGPAATTAPSPVSTFATTTEGTATTTTAIPSQKDAAWAIFQSYLAALKKHDLPSVASLSYQLSAVCKDAAKTKDCNALMDSAYSFGTMLAKNDFTHSAGDAKQFIMYGDYIQNLEGSAPSMTREIIYFAVKDGGLKLLSFSPFDGSFVLRAADSTTSTSTIQANLEKMSIDTDGDTLPDDTELCLGQAATTDCTKTDPMKKDTNGNGWWDSIEKLFYK